MSYHRKCKRCGRTIQMRQMPHGQWVAFEGYDTPHNCSKPIPKGSNPKPLPLFKNPPSGKKEPENYEDLGFPDISIPGQGTQPKSRNDNLKPLPIFENPPQGIKELENYEDYGFHDIPTLRQGTQTKDVPLADLARKVDSFPGSHKEKTAPMGTKRSYVVQQKAKSNPSKLWWIIFWIGIILLLILIS